MLKQTGLCFLVGALGAAACGGPSDTDYSGTPSAGHATSGGSSGSGGSSKGGSSATGGSGGSAKGGTGGSSKGGTGGGATGGGAGMGVGGTTDVGGSGGSTAGTDTGGTGGDVAMGGTGGMTTGGSAGMTSGGKGGNAGAGPNCDDLATAYAAALDAAKVCDPNSGKDQCTELVASSLNCGCDEFANPDNRDAMADLTRIKKEGAKCAQICPAIACLPPEQGTCQQDPDGGDKAGHCLTASGPLPLR